MNSESGVVLMGIKWLNLWFAALMKLKAAVKWRISPNLSRSASAGWRFSIFSWIVVTDGANPLLNHHERDPERSSVPCLFPFGCSLLGLFVSFRGDVVFLSDLCFCFPGTADVRCLSARPWRVSFPQRYPVSLRLSLISGARFPLVCDLGCFLSRSRSSAALSCGVLCFIALTGDESEIVTEPSVYFPTCSTFTVRSFSVANLTCGPGRNIASNCDSEFYTWYNTCYVLIKYFDSRIVVWFSFSRLSSSLQICIRWKEKRLICAKLLPT